MLQHSLINLCVYSYIPSKYVHTHIFIYLFIYMYVYVVLFSVAPTAAPQNFTLSTEDTILTLSWQPPPLEDRNGVIISYTLVCLGGESSSINIILRDILQISLYELSPNTLFSCNISASTSAGQGPYTESVSGTTAGKINCHRAIPC